jgi:RimJ/RimL family protein N-acetyltransferase
VIFETERLVVRPYTRQDVEFVFDMYSRWEVQRFIGATPRVLQGTDEALAAIERWQALSQADALSGAWAVTLRSSGELLGTVMLKQLPLSAPSRPLPLSGDCEIGWPLHPGHWGHGYATEVGAGVMRRV